MADNARQRILSDKTMFESFYVPETFHNLSTEKILVSEFIVGRDIDDLEDCSQETKNRVGELLLRLSLKELFNWQSMQTDPNPANFFYDVGSGKLNLIDFGASRDFDPHFINCYMGVVRNAALLKSEAVLMHSIGLGMLSGEENAVMKEGYINASYAMGLPF